MKTIYIRGGVKEKAVEVLTHHLKDLGHKVVKNNDKPYDARVCWGTSKQFCEGTGLNDKINKYDKYQAILQFQKAGVSTPEVYKIEDIPDDPKPFPWLGRNVHHEKGKDILVINKLSEAFKAAKAGKEFFSILIPSQTEYRVWAFQGKAFAVTEKIKTGENKQFGNFDRGYTFENRNDLLRSRALCEVGEKAVKALQMDFGAVDILSGKDGKYYALEVNSMPEIDLFTRVSGIRLAKLISNWAEQR